MSIPRPIYHPKRAPGGFTLIEILATLLILAIALPAVVALVLGNSRAGQVAGDRNTAAMIISEAVADIERMHTITPGMLVSGTPVPVSHVGLMIETVQPASYYPPDPLAPRVPYAAPNIHAVFEGVDYGALRPRSPNSSPGPYALRQKFLNPNSKNTLYWPPTGESPRYGGPLQGSTMGPTGTNGTPYRVLYQLNRHPDWIVYPQSPFINTYVLTLAVYRDLSPQALPEISIATPGNPVKKLEQVSDPVVVYLSPRREIP